MAPGLRGRGSLEGSGAADGVGLSVDLWVMLSHRGLCVVGFIEDCGE